LKNLGVVVLLLLSVTLIAISGVSRYNDNVERNEMIELINSQHHTNELLYNRVLELDNLVDDSPEKIRFITLVDHYVRESAICDMDTHERNLYARYLWQYGNEFDTGHLEEDYIPLRTRLLAIGREESGFNTRAKSTAKAVGLQQLMPATYRVCMMMLNESPDNRTDAMYDMRKQVRFSAFWLRMLYDDHGEDWNAAINAYNCNSCNYETAYTIKVKATAQKILLFAESLQNEAE
jgi:hypothetical protein